MKKSSLYALASAGLLLAACSDNAPKELVGTISDASMNTLTVKTLERTVTFTTEGADMQQANGLLLGSPVTVEYRGKLTDATPALKVATNPTYYQAVGSWTQPNPIDPAQRQGVELQVEGVARSIGMATLRFSTWELTTQPGHILLLGESEGSGAPAEVRMEGVISAEEGRLTLNLGDGMLLTREEE
ncbi:lipocalin family protein [uncultured Alistipes sp.]|jgi:hypothetical protein|uniref:lipocalin family protein n=1 Tax=Alistipes sp. TaxID=1872444 RepID=UPI00266B49A1|nr:lipocalin family protein [uncultured Alistipes sp.]